MPLPRCHEPDTGDGIVIGLCAGHRKDLQTITFKTGSHGVNNLVGPDRDSNVGRENRGSDQTADIPDHFLDFLFRILKAEDERSRAMEDTGGLVE